MDIIISIIRWIIRFFTGEVDEKYYEQHANEKFPYRKKDYLLTITEKEFYRVLSEVAQKKDLLVFVKVRLEDLLWLPRYTQNILRWRGYVRSRHIDFVLCDKQNIKPLLAIELDDSSHQRPDRIGRDERIDHILHDAGLPILHIRVQHSYNFSILENQIRDVINLLDKK